MSENNIRTGAYTNADGDSVPFVFKTSLSMQEKMSFVKSVTNTIVGDNYMSIARDMFFDFYIIEFFTSVDTKAFYDDNVNGSETVDMIEKLLNETNIVDIIKSNIDNSVLVELNRAVDLDIEYRTGIRENTIETSLIKLIDTFDKKIENVDSEDMMNAVGMLVSMSDELTPEKMIDAFVKTDVFKANHETVEDA